MNPRERVRLALNHQEPDRIPIDLGATIVSSIAKQTYVDEALMQRFGVDFRMVQLPAATAAGVHIFEDGGSTPLP